MRTLQRKFRTTLLAQFIHPTTAVEASFGGLHLHLKVGGLEATKSDINVLATNLESVSNCAFSQDNQHDAASNSFHSRLHWSRYVIIDDDEIKAYIILHNYIDHKTRWYNYVHNQHWAVPADQDQGRGWNSTPSWGRSLSMVSFGRKYLRKSSNSFS